MSDQAKLGKRVLFGAKRLSVSLLVIAALFQPLALNAQSQDGRIVGRVMDAETGRGLVGATISLQGTNVGTLSGVDGRYTLNQVPSGPQTLTVSYLGYSEKNVTGIEIPASGAMSLDVAMMQAALAVQGVTVSVSSERGSISRALDEQRTAVGVVSAVTAQQISRSPDGDAAQAVQRVSGVTVRDGGSVFVRGLGERYTTTSLNGARLPSPDPERRIVPLDLFPSALLQSVSTTKTFTPNLSGDFAGAQVNVATREFPTQRQLTISTSAGFSNGFGRSIFSPPTYGGEWLASGATKRAAPAALATPAAVRQLTTQDAVRAAIGQLRFGDLRPGEVNGAPNSSFGISLGGRDPIFGRDVGYIASLTYSRSQDFYDDEVRANMLSNDPGKEEWVGSTGRSGITAGGMLNLSTMFGINHQLSLNNTYTRTADNEAREDFGYTHYFLVPARRSTVRYVERSVRSSQLRGEHAFGIQHQLDWDLTAAGVSREEPDRTDMVYVQFPESGGGTYLALPIGDPEGLRRTYGALSESNYSASANYRYSFGSGVRPWDVRFGGTYRYTDREASNFQFSVFPTALPYGAARNGAEDIFSLAATGEGMFNVSPANEAGSYTAAEHLGAGYAMLEVPIGERLRVIGGARLEAADLGIQTEQAGGRITATERNDVDVLPSLVVNLALSEIQTLRFSASQTLARPEYREISPFAYLEVIGGEITKGNPNLRRSLIRNLDLKWEMYPGAGEVLSVGLFAKQFAAPIERIDMASGGPSVVTFVNAKGATNLGVEAEIRTGLNRLAPALEPLSIFGNVTLMRSDIEIGEGVSANTNPSRAMIGQAPYVVNVGLNYTPASNANATLLFNVVGERIWAAGSLPMPDIYEEPRNMLDFSLRFPMPGAVSARFDAKNLLDTPYELRQGDVIKHRYRSGRTFTVGFSFSPSL